MSRRIATLNTTGKKSRSPSNDNENPQQGFYVGGSEQSGNLVLGPDSSRNEDFVSQFFKSVRAHGAEPLTQEENEKLGTRDALKLDLGNKSISNRLGSSALQSQLAESNDSSDAQEVTLSMWENGFTINDGPLRRYSDELNNSFLQSVSEGHIPNELIRQHPGKIIDLRMVRRPEPYINKPKPFTGQGQRLGEIVPKIASPENFKQRTSNSRCVDSDSVKKAQEAVKLVAGEPTAHVQIRLPNGERIVGQFNHNHTISDIRNFLVNAAPDYAFQPFSLMTTFPNKVIEQENISLKEAGVLNAVIVAKLV